jgi:hypothetical protein
MSSGADRALAGRDRTIASSGDHGRVAPADRAGELERAASLERRGCPPPAAPEQLAPAKYPRTSPCTTPQPSRVSTDTPRHRNRRSRVSTDTPRRRNRPLPSIHRYSPTPKNRASSIRRYPETPRSSGPEYTSILWSPEIRAREYPPILPAPAPDDIRCPWILPRTSPGVRFHPENESQSPTSTCDTIVDRTRGQVPPREREPIPDVDLRHHRRPDTRMSLRTALLVATDPRDRPARPR